MQKTIRGVLCLLAVLSQPIWAAEHVDSKVFDKKTIRFDDLPHTIEARSSTAAQQPFILNRKNINSAEFEAKLSWLTMGKVTLADGKTYNRIQLPNGGHPADPGKPNLTGYQQMIRISDDAQVGVVIDDIQWSDTFNNIIIDPVQLPFPDAATIDGIRLDEHLPFVKDEQAYHPLMDTDTVMLSKPVQLVETIRVRGKSYAIVSYQPIEFNPVTESVRFAKKVRFHLNSVVPNINTPKTIVTDALQPEHSDSGSIFDVRSEPSSVMTDNVSAVESKSSATLTPAQAADYLIITADKFRDEIEPLAVWKRKKGYNVYVATISESGRTQEEIKNYISNAYHHGPMTSYVLLVGDHEDLPGWKVIGHPAISNTHEWHTDFDYTLVDGVDKYPDLVIGRFAADKESQVKTMVKRTLDYEKNPIISDRYSHILLAGQFQDRGENGKAPDNKADRMFMEDLHRIADFLGADYDFFQSDGDHFNKGYQIHTALQWDSATTNNLTYGGWSYGSGRITPPASVPQVWKNQGAGDGNDITTAIRDGVGIVVHRDHGYDGGEGWADPHFNYANVKYNLVNGLFPVVLSLNCATGWFDGKDLFAESWVRNPNGGAVGFLGAARISYSGPNDLFHVGLMDTFWNDYDNTWSSALYPLSWKPAMAMTRAKHRVFDQYGTRENGKGFITARLFNWLGDPELELRTLEPKNLTVTHPANLPPTSNATFNITVQREGAPLKDARVALVSQSGKTHVVLTDQAGRASFSFKTDKTMSVTVTEHNAIPYEGTISVASPVNHAKPSSGKSGGTFSFISLIGLVALSVYRRRNALL
ncbi:C25 family cysteine peptidase [uncultured Photobacterium sp.]|uniref:C25 family cysteine peptidase n=1 Tax=uncultured Photobacterium sp. TaxID=173973 RepID=UPI00263A1122|nr:C25 family cysteine peptidase [uncultured Photobacterium sp.]